MAPACPPRARRDSAMGNGLLLSSLGTVSAPQLMFPPCFCADVAAPYAPDDWDEDEPERPSFPFEGRDTAVKANSVPHLLGQFISRTVKEQNHRHVTYSWLDWLAIVIPAVGWLRTYKRAYILADLVAGISVGFTTVPQGMAFAAAAGLPSVFGLYGAFTPVLAYALMGSSRQLIVGPGTITSQLMHAQLISLIPGLSTIHNPNTVTGEQVAIQAAYNHAAIQVAFLVAILYTTVGVLRLGFLTNFLSHSIIGGFLSANAVLIGLTQLKSILQIPLPSPEPTTLPGLLGAYFRGANHVVWESTLMGLGLIALMVVMGKIGGLKPSLIYVRAAAPVVASLIGLLAQYIGHVDEKHIPLIGNIPAGLPSLTTGWWLPLTDIAKLFPVAITVMFIDLVGSISIARGFARKNNYLLAPNQEIVALGAANFAGAAFNAFNCTGSFSRSGVNDACGARTPLASVVSALIVGAVLLWLGPVFQNLPSCVLGAIVVTAMLSLFDYQQVIHLWKVNSLDWLCWMTVFLGVLFISVEIGIAIAVGLAIILVIYQSAFPSIHLLGRVPGSAAYRSVSRHTDSELTAGVMAFRMEASLYYANQQVFKDTAERLRKKFSVWSTNQGVGLAFAIVDLGAVMHVDSSGVRALEDLMVDFRKHTIQVVLANPSIKVLRMLEVAGFPDLLGREWVFVSMRDAHVFCQSVLQEQGIVSPVVAAKEAINSFPA